MEVSELFKQIENLVPIVKQVFVKIKKLSVWYKSAQVTTDVSNLHVLASKLPTSLNIFSPIIALINSQNLYLLSPLSVL